MDDELFVVLFERLTHPRRAPHQASAPRSSHHQAIEHAAS
jgi:hypothetical protein